LRHATGKVWEGLEGDQRKAPSHRPAPHCGPAGRRGRQDRAP